MRAIPKITVRIDRGEDWVEISEDWQSTSTTVCGEGDVKDWIDYSALYDAWHTLNQAVTE
ncbi:hypothetical protein LCGC14_1834520 [marine sediment metagenome]|uniref:Uncharacterized protein n=1 Tax=marine sediment metagenome TaxID=412755 RepID=A0A0F9IUK1_9ZZZZ